MPLPSLLLPKHAYAASGDELRIYSFRHLNRVLHHSAGWIDRKRAYRCLRGDILDALGRQNEACLVWEDAIGGHVDFTTPDEFELGWMESAAYKLNRQEALDHIRTERQFRAKKVKRITRQGELPVFVGQALRDPAEEV